MNFEVIRAAMQEEIDNPRQLYLPNSPGSYVRDRLFRQTYWEEATWFWGRYCSRSFNVESLDALLPELDALQQSMPDWGHKGT